MGQDPDLLAEVCGWVNAAASVPVWAKMTPNITDIAVPASAALAAGCEGVSAINTITSVSGVDLKTLRPQPSVLGYTTPGGYSYTAVKPIALAKVHARWLGVWLLLLLFGGGEGEGGRPGRRRRGGRRPGRRQRAHVNS